MLLGLAACSHSPVEVPNNGPLPQPANGHRILFIGNSLTYVNDVPGLVAEFAKECGDTVYTKSVAYPNFALIDHINEGTALNVLASAHWDYVVLQQGPTTLGINRDSLILWTRMFDPYIRAAGARPALYMVWPDSSHLNLMSSVHDSFAMAADAVNGLFLPAGDAWTIAWESSPGIALYGPDNFHPSILGSTLAALVITERLVGVDVRTMKPELIAQFTGISFDEAQILILSAHAANAQAVK